MHSNFSTIRPIDRLCLNGSNRFDKELNLELVTRKVIENEFTPTAVLCLTSQGRRLDSHDTSYCGGGDPINSPLYG